MEFIYLLGQVLILIFEKWITDDQWFLISQTSLRPDYLAKRAGKYLENKRWLLQNTKKYRSSNAHENCQN